MFVAVVTFFKVVSWIEDEVVVVVVFILIQVVPWIEVEVEVEVEDEVVVVVILIQVVPWIEVLLHTLIDWMRTEGEEGREVKYLFRGKL